MNNTMPNWLIKRADLTPRRTALIFGDKSWSFEEMLIIVKETAGKLAALSIGERSRVAILMGNRPETIFIIHGLQQIGAETVFLNTRLAPDEWAFQLTDCQADILLYENRFEQSVSQLPVKTVCIDDLPEERIEAKIQEVFGLEDVCSIMYTSGTTGKPKGVLQTYGNHWWSATSSALNIGLQEDDMWLCTVPLYHISGFSILLRSVIYGIPVLLMEKFDERSVNDLLSSGKVTIMSAVSSMLIRMLSELGDGTYHPNFRCMLLGGGPAPRPLLETCKRKNIPVYQTYGMTETVSQIVTLSPEDSLDKLGSAGKPLFPFQLKIMADGRETNPLEAGEIFVKGPNITPGYLNREDANRDSFHDGWFATGDIGYLDEEGYVFVLDRRSDLIISGGENIYPAEIEEVLLAHPSVVEAGVTGVEDEKWGKVPYAFFVACDDIPEEELIDFCRKKLASYKVPKKFIRIQELPKNGANKLVRRELIQYAK
ncbi:o-succinylbenzoate--CoA ligase [Siminovitchia sp. 179-K 8D1 HS]|uniref:o-succinylbenzoate--CoA ligase n=1 Tax=Siminovitchia sp. 179-K 8D1 HS TaxID=3142385 RepID=UPI00399F36FB